ncbi:hypothetical protein AHAS_Ahas11G0085100 [Arachis hypogaea]
MAYAYIRVEKFHRRLRKSFSYVMIHLDNDSATNITTTTEKLYLSEYQSSWEKARVDDVHCKHRGIASIYWMKLCVHLQDVDGSSSSSNNVEEI